MLKHLEVDHGHGEHNGIHHGKVVIFVNDLVKLSS